MRLRLADPGRKVSVEVIEQLSLLIGQVGGAGHEGPSDIGAVGAGVGGHGDPCFSRSVVSPLGGVVRRRPGCRPEPFGDLLGGDRRCTAMRGEVAQRLVAGTGDGVGVEDRGAVRQPPRDAVDELSR